MEILLVRSQTEPKLNYYLHGKYVKHGENYQLLGFEDDLPVIGIIDSKNVNSVLPLPVKTAVLCENNIGNNKKLTELGIDHKAESSITLNSLNGQKFKSLPQDSSLSAVTEVSLSLPALTAISSNSVNKTENLQEISPNNRLNFDNNSQSGEKFLIVNGQRLKVVPQGAIPEHVRRSTLLLKNLKTPLTVINVNNKLDNNPTKLVEKKPDKNIVQQQIKYVQHPVRSLKHSMKVKSTTILRKSDNKVIQRIVFDKAPKTSETPSNRIFNSTGAKPQCYAHKLLTYDILRVLTKAKMQQEALNLSMETYKKLINKTASVSTVGTQTADKRVTDRIVQTDAPAKFDIFEYLENTDLFELQTPIAGNEAYFGVRPVVPYLKSNNEESDLRTKKKLLFFNDLRGCLAFNAEGNLPLHEAVINNNRRMVKRNCLALQVRKMDANLKNHNGYTALQLAIKHKFNNAEIAKCLLDFGASIIVTDEDGNNILHLCAKERSSSILATIFMHTSMQLYRISSPVNDFNFEGLTPLMICCINSWIEGVTIFLNNRANLNLQDLTSGRTALFHAAESQNANIIKLLLHHNADPKIKNFFGTSPHDAMYELDDMSEEIKLLIFGKSKKRWNEAEMNPTKTAKAAKIIKTYRKLELADPRIEQTSVSHNYTKIRVRKFPNMSRTRLIGVQSIQR